MVSTRKKKQSSRKLLSQSDDFDQDFFIGNTVSDRQENATVIEGTCDHELGKLSAPGTRFDRQSHTDHNIFFNAFVS